MVKVFLVLVFHMLSCASISEEVLYGSSGNPQFRILIATDPEWTSELARQHIGAISSGTKVELSHPLGTPDNLQPFVCNVPSPEDLVKRAPEGSDSEQNVDLSVESVQKLITSDLENRCLLKNERWWSYEFCRRDQVVRQFHPLPNCEMNPADVYLLGNVYVQENSRISDKFFSEFYSGGTGCDLRDVQRSTEVRYICSPGKEASFISRIEEPQTCQYVLYVNTPTICAHAAFRPYEKPVHDIVCAFVGESVEQQRKLHVLSTELGRPLNVGDVSNILLNGQDLSSG